MCNQDSRRRTQKESPEKGERSSRKDKILVREFKRSSGSTRAAAGICVTKIVGGGNRKEFEEEEGRACRKEKILVTVLKGLRVQP